MILTHAELASASLGMAPAFMSTYQTLIMLQKGKISGVNLDSDFKSVTCKNDEMLEFVRYLNCASQIWESCQRG